LSKESAILPSEAVIPVSTSRRENANDVY